MHRLSALRRRLDRRPGEDRGAVLVMALILCVILGMVSTGLARYATTALQATRVTDERNERAADADAGLRLALEQLRQDPASCGEDPTEGYKGGAAFYVPSSSINATSVLVDCVRTSDGTSDGYETYSLVSRSTASGTSVAVSSVQFLAACTTDCAPTIQAWGIADVAAATKILKPIAKVPGAPSAVTGIGASAQVTVSWTAPASDGGSAITGYTVVAAPGTATCTTTGATSCIVTGLTNGTAYTFKVTGSNVVGTGAESPVSAAVVPLASPGAPTSVVGALGAGQATVSWTAPVSDGGSPITAYAVTSTPGSFTCTTAGATICTVPGLSNGTAYTFTVTATNAVGTSTPSVASSAVTPRTVPGAPTGVVVAPGNAQATISWTAPASDGGSPITRYDVTSSPGNFTCTSIAATSCTVGGMSNGTAFTFIVTATNAAGTGAASVVSSPVTPRTVPGAPTSVAGVAGNTQATVSWTAPSNGGSAITGYTVTSSPGSFTCTTTAATTCTVNGLTNGTAYTFIVTAANAAGSSAASVASTAVTPRTVPGVPTGVTAVAGAASATVSWTAPSSNGGSAITGYTATSSPGGLTCTSTSATSCTVLGLTNGTAYTFTVTATNLAGSSPASSASSAVTPRSAPSAPTGLSGTPGGGQVALTWTAPTSDGASAITGYTVTSSPGSSICTTTVATGCTVLGLTNGTAYTFTVTATNAIGTSAPSTAAAVTPRTVASAPGTPSGVVGDTAVTLSWAAPSSNGGSTITDYTVVSSPGAKTCTTATTSCTVSGLTNGTAYTFTVTAANAAGTGASSAASSSLTPRTVPGAPVTPAAVAGAGQATVTWAAPSSNGGSTITGYTVTSSPGSFTCTTTGALSCTVTGLTNGTAYTFVVDATNVAGTGPDSSASAAVTPKTVPGAPTAISGTPGSTQITVSWTAPFDNGSPITGYTVTSSPGSFTCTTTGALSCTVTGLTNGTAYTFTVRATNALGTGAASAASSSVTPRTVPGAPTGVTGTSGNAQVVLTWTAPSSNGGSAVTGYSAVASPGGASCTTTGALTCTILGLTNGTAYTFVVDATNAAGTGADSSASASVTPRTVPGAPTTVTGTAGAGQVTVSWTAPSSNGGSAIMGYTVTSSPGSFTCTTTGATNCTVSSLSNGTAYTFTVRATNAVGAGAASAASSSVTPRTVPGQPGTPTGVAGNTQVTVTWTAPSSNGGSAITGYTAMATPDGETCTTAGTLTCAITGLTNGTSYTFAVTATNIAGNGATSTASSAVIPRTVPGAPTGAAATPGNAQATVSWTAPSSNGGSAITGYTVLSTPGSKTCTTTGATSCTVTGLTNGTSYTFVVDATNIAGTGADSAASAAVIPVTVPGAPTSVTGVVGNGQVTVSWTAPSNGGSAITAYHVISSPGSFTCTSSATSCVVSGLTNGTAYTFVVDATNAVGTGADSTASAALTPRTVPGAPTNGGFSATASATSEVITWTVPTSNGGSAITGFTATAVPTSGTTRSCTASGASATTCTIASLVALTQYTVTVTATNAAGASAGASIALPGVPATMTAPTATAGPGADKVTVSWTAPANNGGTITGYTVTANNSGGTCTTAGATTCLFSNLTGSSYRFTVYATNARGNGTASAQSTAVTPP